MNPIDQVNINLANPALQAELIKQAESSGLLKDKKKKEESSHLIECYSGEVEGRLDAIRQTHIKILKQQESEGIEQGSQTPTSKAAAEDEQANVEAIEGEPAAREVDEMRNTMVLQQANLNQAEQPGYLETTDVLRLVRHYSRATSGSYTTNEGYKVYVFDDPGTNKKFFTFMIPLGDGNFEELSVFITPDNPEKANIFRRRYAGEG